MKQQCYLWSIWLTWISLPVLAGIGWFFAGWPAAMIIALSAVTWQIVYLRLFPRFSASMGYGSVADVPAPSPEQAMPALTVTLYTASACPFCPLVRKRLLGLQQQLGFSFAELDVTFRPAVIAAKKLRAVPAVEVNGQVRAGNLTSAEILAFLSNNGAIGT